MRSLPVLALAAALLCLACAKEKPPAPVAPPPAPVAPAPVATPAPAAPEPAPAATPVVVEKSDELRFIETNAAMLCAERSSRKQLTKQARAKLLASNGFAGAAGEERYTQLSLRGDRDLEWGKRVTDRIKLEMEALCPHAKK